MGETVTYRVVKEPYGWAVRMQNGLMTPFRSQKRATDHARGLADLERALGRAAVVVIDQAWPTDSPAWRRSTRRPQLHWLVARATF